jgi:hypothetical protein
VGVPAASTPQASVIIVVRHQILAASLELALLASGLTVLLFDPEQGLDTLPLDSAMTLIVDHHVLAPAPLAFVEGLRALPWDGLVILMTGDSEPLNAAFESASRIAVLEMPFGGSDLIAAIRAVWPAEGRA